MNLDLRKVPFYYINLERQPERMEKMEELLSSLEIEEYYRIDAKSHQNGFAGCAQTVADALDTLQSCLLYTSPSPRDLSTSRMPSSA